VTQTAEQETSKIGDMWALYLKQRNKPLRTDPDPKPITVKINIFLLKFYFSEKVVVLCDGSFRNQKPGKNSSRRQKKYSKQPFMIILCYFT
jgi:hypothetical protein